MNASPAVSTLSRSAAPTSMRVVAGDYEVRLAETEEQVRAAQELRYAVFCTELGEGLAGAHRIGRDEDRFDAQFDHLLLLERESGAVVGTYRMQTAARARAGAGFYCDGEFVLTDLPEALLADAIELGRACIARHHRRGMALLALWRGLAAYLLHRQKRYLFGCCSLTGTDPRTAVVASHWLRDQGHDDPALHVHVRPGLGAPADEPSAAELAAFRPPQLFSTYLRHGAKVCGGPALDREFGTTDFLIVLDVAELSPRQRALFFA
jgi:putative hemolysin